MNVYLTLLSETFDIAKKNHENKDTLQFIDQALSWAIDSDCEAEIGFSLPNTCIEAYDGIYYLSSFSPVQALNEINFPTLLNAACASYALYLEEYECATDIVAFREAHLKEIQDTVSPFTTRQFEVSDHLLELSAKWCIENLPF